MVGAVNVIAMGTITYYHAFTELRSDVFYMVKVIASNCAGSNNKLDMLVSTCSMPFCGSNK